MRLLGRERLYSLRAQGAEVENWVRSWAAEVVAAHWKQPSDVREQFPNSRYHGEGQFLFPVSNCGVAISLLVAFPQGIALIADLKVEDEIR
jgi:mRNA interferase HigB